MSVQAGKEIRNMNSFFFTLKKPVELAKKGEVELVFELEIKAPTGQNRAQLIRVKQGFVKAIRDNVSSGKEVAAPAVVVDEPVNPFEDATPQQIMGILYNSNVDLVLVQEEFKKLLMAGGAFADGVQLTGYHLDRLDFDDFEAIMGQYLKVFIGPSLI